MSENNELGRLEEIVEDLLGRYNKLEEENEKYIATIEKKNSEIENLRSRLTGLEDEKNQVTNRISGILRSIEVWESRKADDQNEDRYSELESDQSKSKEEWPKLFGTDKA